MEITRRQIAAIKRLAGALQALADAFQECAKEASQSHAESFPAVVEAAAVACASHRDGWTLELIEYWRMNDERRTSGTRCR